MRDEATCPSTKPSLGAVVLVFLLLSLTNFGGAQSSAIYREVVRRRSWIGTHEFMEYRSIAQLAPGANSPNLAVLIGARLHGPIGAGAAFIAATLPCVLILLALGALTVRLESPAVRGALAGAAAAAIGCVAANAIEMTTRYARTRVLLIVIAVALSVAVLHLSLVLTLAFFIPLGLAIERRR